MYLLSNILQCCLHLHLIHEFGLSRLHVWYKNIQFIATDVYAIIFFYSKGYTTSTEANKVYTPQDSTLLPKMLQQVLQEKSSKHSQCLVQMMYAWSNVPALILHMPSSRPP